MGTTDIDPHFVLLLLYLRVKTQQYFVSLSYMFLDKKTVLKIWLSPGFEEPGPAVQVMKILSNVTDAFGSKSMGCLCFNSICTCSNADPSKSHLKEMM